MAIKIKQKRPTSFGIKVGIAVIVASIILGSLLRLTGNEDHDSNTPISGDQLGISISSKMLVPLIRLPVNNEAPEKEWSDALVTEINGKSEVEVDRGRADVMTDNYAIEIDFLKKWHEGLGQAIHYGSESSRIGVLALILEEGMTHEDLKELELLRKIDRLCTEKGIKLILLVPMNENS